MFLTFSALIYIYEFSNLNSLHFRQKLVENLIKDKSIFSIVIILLILSELDDHNVVIVLLGENNIDVHHFWDLTITWLKASKTLKII